MAVIDAIAAGHHRITDIAHMAGLSRSHISKYLSVLQELGYVERRVPATVRRPDKSGKGRYVITDPYLRFYFRFLHPNLSFIERGMRAQAINLMNDHLVDFIGTHTFEELCQDRVAVQADQGNLPFLPDRVGSFWSQQAQIDAPAINWRTKDILLGECKWGTPKLGKASSANWWWRRPKKCCQKASGLFTMPSSVVQGFTQAAHKEAKGIQAQLVTLEKLELDLHRPWMKNRT